MTKGNYPTKKTYGSLKLGSELEDDELDAIEEASETSETAETNSPYEDSVNLVSSIETVFDDSGDYQLNSEIKTQPEQPKKQDSADKTEQVFSRFPTRLPNIKNIDQDKPTTPPTSVTSGLKNRVFVRFAHPPGSGPDNGQNTRK